MKEIIGHGELISHFEAAVREGKVGHAYVLEGEKGSGKLFLAKHFAKILLGANADGNPDFVRVTHEKPNVISVEEIRTQVVNTADVKPYAANYKVYVMEDADRMREEAQNALLKTLEEPPEYVVIFLLSENSGKLLATIRSRAVKLSVKPVDVHEIRDYIVEKYEVPDYLATEAAEFSAGNVGRAIRYATDGDFVKMKEEMVGILRGLDREGVAEHVRDMKVLSEYRTEIRDCLALVTLWFRDVLVLKATGDANALIFKEEYGTLREQAAARDYAAVEGALGAVDKARTRLDANVNFDTVMELLFAKLKEHGG